MVDYLITQDFIYISPEAISVTAPLQASVKAAISATTTVEARVQGTVEATVTLNGYVVKRLSVTAAVNANVKGTLSQTIGVQAIVQGFFDPVESAGTPYSDCLVHMYRDLADEHVYNRDFMDTTDFRTYDILRMYCRQLTYIGYRAAEIRTNAVSETCENIRLYDNFGRYFEQDKLFEQPSDIHNGELQGYRRQCLFAWYAGTLGGTQAALRWMAYGILGISPKITALSEKGWLLAHPVRSVLGSTTTIYQSDKTFYGVELVHFIPTTILGSVLTDVRARLTAAIKEITHATTAYEEIYSSFFDLYATKNQLLSGTYDSSEFLIEDARIRVQTSKETAGGTFTYISPEIDLASIVSPIGEYTWYADWCSLEADDHTITVYWAGRDIATSEYTDWAIITNKEDPLVFTERSEASYDIGAYEYVLGYADFDRIKLKFNFTILQEGNVRYATLYSYGVKAIGAKVLGVAQIQVQAYVST